MRTKNTYLALPLALIAMTSIPAIADSQPVVADTQPGVANSQITIGNSPSFFEGTYGTQNNIDVLYDATYLQYQNGNTLFKLTVPYENIKGLPVGAILSGAVVTHGTSTQTRNSSGLGDIWLEGDYTALPAAGLRPSITPYAKIKFGTASQASGLGTGENDYEAGFNFQQTLSPTLYPFASVGYRVVGNPAGYALENLWSYKAGASYAVKTMDFLTAMVSGTSAQVVGQVGPSDLIVAWNHNTSATGSGFQLFLDKGLTNTTSNFGVGASIQYVF